MNSFLNLSTNAIKTADSLIRHAKEETYDEVEDSIKSLRKNSKAEDVKHSIELCAIYWHFLLAVWLVLFGLMLFT